MSDFLADFSELHDIDKWWYRGTAPTFIMGYWNKVLPDGRKVSLGYPVYDRDAGIDLSAGADNLTDWG